MTAALTLRLMTEHEALRLVGWAAEEGWNPGLHDAQVFWATDPEAFVAAELDGELIGGGTITSYDGAFGFMGLFIVRPRFRGQGFGRMLWLARVRLLQARLRSGAAIGLDGVPARQDWYARGGFRFSHRTLRYQGQGAASEPAAGIVPAAAVPFERLAALDRRCFPAPRERFLRAWLEQPEARALAAVEGGRLLGYGVTRRCRSGTRIGPLFADDPTVAEALFTSLAAFVPGEPVYLDVPEVNAWAMALARRQQLREVLATARMYLGRAPRLEESRIFGVTTCELG